MHNTLSPDNMNLRDFSDAQTVTVIHNASYGESGTSALKASPSKPKVASYCRVSSLTDPQEESLENQTIHYTNYIRSNIAWHFAGIYSDRGKTGTRIENRGDLTEWSEMPWKGKLIPFFVNPSPVLLEMLRTPLTPLEHLAALG